MPENYIHRIGRTGRADKKGIAITFITEKEKPLQKAIEELMKQPIPMLDLPETLEISDVLTEDEKPKVRMKIIQIKLPKKEEVGASFHEKSAKNSKVNVRKNRKEIMQKKSGEDLLLKSPSHFLPDFFISVYRKLLSWQEII